jgi:FG-GAP-like repeat/ASPIC and UnbV
VELHGEKGFSRPESMVLGHDSFKGMSIDFGDINDDGIFDMSVSNIASPFALQESHFLWTSTGRLDRMAAGIAPWIDRADDLGVSHSAWAWDSRFEDFDNDGVLELIQATGLMKGTANRWPDLAQVGAANDVFVRYPKVWPKVHVGSEVDGYYPNPFWALGRDGRYVDLSAQLFPGLTPSTRGIAVADVDGDGDLDLCETVNGGSPVLLRCDAPAGRGVTLAIAGAPLGAKVTLSAGGRSSSQRIRTGGSYLALSDTRLTFALPDGRPADQVRIAVGDRPEAVLSGSFGPGVAKPSVTAGGSPR